MPDQQGRTIIGESRRIKDIAAVVEKPEAIEILMKVQTWMKHIYIPAEKEKH